jgi:hypothetical protein
VLQRHTTKILIDALDKRREFIESNLTEASLIFSKTYDLGQAEVMHRIDDIHFLNATENQLAMKPSDQTSSVYTSGRIIASTFFQDGEVASIIGIPRMISAEFVNNIS